MPIQANGWMSREEPKILAEEIVELNREDVILLIKETTELGENVSSLYLRNKLKPLNDAVVYLASVENSLNQLL